MIGGNVINHDNLPAVEQVDPNIGNESDSDPEEEKDRPLYGLISEGFQEVVESIKEGFTLLENKPQSKRKFTVEKDRPMFDGNPEELEDWITEMLLLHHDYTNREVQCHHQPEFITKMVSYFKEGSVARVWFRMYASQRIKMGFTLSWMCLVDDLRVQFAKAKQTDSYFAEYYNMVQDSDVKTYIAHKSELALRAVDLNDNLKLEGFIRGLRPRIKEYVMLQNPETLEKAQTQAIAFENSTLDMTPRKRYASDARGSRESKTKRVQFKSTVMKMNASNVNGYKAPSPSAASSSGSSSANALKELRGLRNNRCYVCGVHGHRKETCKATAEDKIKFQDKISKLKGLIKPEEQ